MSYDKWHYGGSSYGPTDGFDGMGNPNPAWPIEKALSQRDTRSCFDGFGNILPGFQDYYAYGKSFEREQAGNRALAVDWNNMLQGYEKQESASSLPSFSLAPRTYESKPREENAINDKAIQEQNMNPVNPNVTIFWGGEVIGSQKPTPKQKLIIHTSFSQGATKTAVSSR